mgnify:CR=1 FL=1
MEKQQEDKIIEMYSKRRPIKWITKETGIKEKVIVKWLKDNNIWTGHKYLLSYFDEFFFDKIDTEEKAYWLGFHYADGYLAKNYTIGIELKSTDYNHLEKFRKSIKAEREVKIYHKNSTFGPQDNCRISFGSKHMYNILLGYYGSINKTLEGTLPKIDKQLEHHLIRGFFDGDGCITYTYKDENHVICPQISFIGTKETMEYIIELSNFNWTWSQRVTTGVNNYQISCGRVNDSLDFLSYMYKDATIWLDRKYDKYQTVLENREHFKVKTRV